MAIMEWFKKRNPFWYILISVVLIFVWGTYGDIIVPEKTVVLLIQIVFMAIGSYGTYLKGELSTQEVSKAKAEKFELHAKARYRHLDLLFWDIVRVSEIIENSKKKNVSPMDRSIMIEGIPGQLKQVLRGIGLCMANWRDFAPNELEELHKELIGKDKEDRHAN